MTEQHTPSIHIATAHSGTNLAPEAQFDALVDALRTGTGPFRIEAAKALSNYGVRGVQALCEALKDKEHDVREAAADSLREIGDDTAVGPLVEALRAGFPGRSPRRQRIMTVLFYVFLPVMIIAALALIVATKGEALIDFFSNLQYIQSPPPKLTGDRLAYIHALSAIAERSPTPALRKVLSDLRDIEADTLQQDVKTRAASRSAARKIEKLTAKLDQLPVMAAAPSPDTAQLPVAGSSSG